MTDKEFYKEVSESLKQLNAELNEERAINTELTQQLKEAEKAIKQNESAIRMLAKQRDEMGAKLKEAREGIQLLESMGSNITLKQLEAKLKEATEMIDKLKNIKRFNIATYVVSEFVAEKEREYDCDGDYVDYYEIEEILSANKQDKKGK